MLSAGGYAHIPMFWTHLECSPQWRCWKRSSLPCLLRLCLHGRWTVSLIFFNLSRFENDTTRHFLENGVLGMVALGTGVTPPMYGSFYVFWFFFNMNSGLQGKHLIPTSQVEFLRLWMLAQMDAYEYTEKGAGWFFWSAKQQVVGLILLSLLLCLFPFWLSLWFLHLSLLLW